VRTPVLVVETADVGEDPARPLEHPIALGSQSLVALGTPHEREAELRLEASDPGRERRLRDVTRACGTAEVLLAGEGDEVGEMP